MKQARLYADKENMTTAGIEAAICDPTPSAGVVSRFGARLRGLRHARGWTQAQMAAIFGIDRSYLSELERGHKAISLPMLEVIAMGFHLRLSDLLDGV
jgi:DNA-binding XRE family transcriptional regulator